MNKRVCIKDMYMLDPVLPLALYLLFGYIFKIFIADNSKQLIDFIIYFSLPSIVFSKVYPLEFHIQFLGLILMFMSFILINLILAYFIGKALKLERKLLASFMLASSFGNTSFIGFSYIDAFYGQEFIIYGLMYDFFGSFLLLVSIGMMIINWGAGKRNDFKRVSKNILLFPPMLIFFVSILLKLVDLPNFVLLTTQSLGSTLVPIAMIAIGMKLELKHIFKKFELVTLALAIKMVLIPVLVLLGFKFFYGLDETWVKVTIIEMAMPPMTMATVLAIKEGLNEKLLVNSLVMGVLLSLLSITIFTNFLS